MPRLVPLHLAARDAAVLGLTGAAWIVDARVRGDGGAASWAAALAAGGLTALSGFLAHEYGHLLASLASGAAVTFPSSPASALLFHFDAAKNDRRQFLWMSAGGYLATALSVGAIAWLAPRDAWSGRVALGLAVAGMAVTFLLEVPITLGVLRGGPLPDGAAYRPHGG